MILTCLKLLNVAVVDRRQVNSVLRKGRESESTSETRSVDYVIMRLRMTWLNNSCRGSNMLVDGQPSLLCPRLVRPGRFDGCLSCAYLEQIYTTLSRS